MTQTTGMNTLRTLGASLLLAAGLTHAQYTAWSGHRDIVLNTSATGANVTENVTKFPVLVRLTNDEAAVMQASKPGGADIRFSKADDLTPLPYQIDTWEPWGAVIWVLVDTIYGNNATQKIRMHWGNPAATSQSNGAAVFDTANGFVAVWHLGNAAGASPRPNSVAGAPTAIFRNALVTQQPVRGIIGMADSLAGGPGSNDGTGDEAGLGHHIDLTGGGAPYTGYSDFTGGFNYSLWVNPNANYANFERFLQMVDDTTYSSANSSGTRIMFLRHTGNSGSLAIRATGITSGTTPTFANHPGVWKHFVVNKAPGTSAMTIYVDGTQFHAYGNTAEIPVSTRQYAWIGRSFDPANNYLNAKVDAPQMSKVARSAAWIKLAYENQKAANSLVNIGLGPDVTGTPYSAWSGHRTITLNTTSTGANVAGDVRNFPVLIRLTQAEALITAASKAGGADVRFSKIDDATPLKYAIESWDSTGAAIWVKVDTVKGNNATQAIRMHWGNPAAADSSNSAAVFDTANGHRAVFHMNQPTGDVVDATANGIVGTNTGTTAKAQGLAGPARTFAGTNAANTSSTTDRQYIEVGTPGALSFTGRVSLSAWVRWTNVVGTENESYYRTIINRDGTSPSAETFLRIGHTSGNVIDQSQYATGKYTGSADIMAQSPLPASGYPDSAVWVHLAGVYDSTGPTSRVWNLYRNGVLLASSADNAQAGLTGAATRWRFGRGPGNQNARWFVGDMDEVRIDNVSRDSNYIKLSYQNQKPGNSLVDIGTYVPPTVPGAPTAVTAATAGATAINVSWTAPASNGGSPITLYTVISTPGNLTCTSTPPATTCQVAGITGGSTSYTFTVTATNAVGNSVASAPSNPATSLRPGSFAIRLDNSRPYTYRLPAGMMSSTEQLTMTIVGVNGKQVWSKTVNPAADKVSELTWDGRQTNGQRAPSGMYIVKLNVTANGQTTTTESRGVNF